MVKGQSAMKPLRLLLLATVVATVVALVPAQNYAPPPTQAPDPADLKTIAERTDKLSTKLQTLRKIGVVDGYRVDAEVYLKAAQWIAQHKEFYHKDAAAWTLEALDRGLLRTSQLGRGEAPWLLETGHPVVRGYRSPLDGSIQPYAVTLPADYGRDLGRKWRLDVVLHGRDTSLTEVKFLHAHIGDRPAPKDQDFVQLDIYGRGNNAYRWAGENDVADAVNSFLQTERFLGRPLIDSDRIVLRGFSMGGAGTWHIGLHHPSRWCAIGPGAGFTATHGYVKDLPDPLPAYQESCLRIYDAVDYAENAAGVPVVAYAGSNDAQLQAARNIEAKLKGVNVPMTLLVAPGLAHQFPPEWQKKAEVEYEKYTGKGRDPYPKHVHFVTYTLKYPECAWVEIVGLDRHYERTLVDAEQQTESSLTVKTTNVRTLHLGLPPGASGLPMKVMIDGQEIVARPHLKNDGAMHLYLTRRSGTWASVLPEVLLTERLRRPRKARNLQGPIDDAFTNPFLCVHGTGKPWHEATQKYADESLQRFQAIWSKHFRGDLPIKDDVDVTSEDIASRHLILFGDPSSNSLIAQVLPGLPLQWTMEKVTLAGKTVSAADHVPVLIYPSPLHPDRYVVLNSGHTFPESAYTGTNALLYSRLGDFALLNLAPTLKDPAAAAVVAAGLFDDSWQ